MDLRNGLRARLMKLFLEGLRKKIKEELWSTTN
jgi:hypothetical protein